MAHPYGPVYTAPRRGLVLGLLETRMTLADFIEANITDLVREWSDYAKSLSMQAHPLSEPQLRDAGAAILSAIAANMRVPQSAAQQQAKSHGSRDPSSAFNVTAGGHADIRVLQGFDINDLVAEFRALRAAVLRRWAQVAPDASDLALEEMTRFNEAIDQALAESVRAYARRIEHGRDLFMAVLAHDLRSPSAPSPVAPTCSVTGQTSPNNPRKSSESWSERRRVYRRCSMIYSCSRSRA